LAGPSAAGVNVTEIVQVVSLPKSAVILTGHPFAAANAELEVAIEGEKLQSAEQWSVRVVPCGPLVDPSGWSVNERLVGESVTVSVRAPAVPVRSAGTPGRPLRRWLVETRALPQPYPRYGESKGSE
jgi:hypothetical protein